MGEQKRKRDWVDCTQADVAACLGVSPDTVANWAKKGMPGSRGKYCVPEIVSWLLSSGPWRPSPRIDSDDPLLAADGDSPGLERYRLAKAAIAELDLEERKGSLLSREKARSVLGRWASIIRRLGERLGKRHGAEASDAVEEAITECQRIIEHELGGNESTDDGTED